MMKIGILCYPTYGGSGIVATELGMHLAKKGYETHFITSEVPARLDMTIPNIFFHRVNVQDYPLFKYQPYGIALSSMIYQVVTLYKLDILHAHYAIPYANAAFMAKQILKEEDLHIPLVTTLHGTDITLVGQHPSYKKSVEFSINKSDTLTSVSHSLKEDTLQTFRIKKEIQVIPNFIDIKEFQSLTKCKRTSFASQDEKILVHMSNLRPVKRIADVMSVFRRINQTIPSRLLILGDGPDVEIVHTFLHRHPELAERVKMLGKVPNPYEILAIADLFLLPSEQESFGLAALEAMAAGTPVISSNAGGIPEVNLQAKTGYITEVGNVEAMANYAIKLLSDPQLYTNIRQNALDRAAEFDINKIIPLYENMYRETIQNFYLN